MASRRFFGYDPYDYYYTAPSYNYTHPYYRSHEPAPPRAAGRFFRDADDPYYGYQHEPAVSRNNPGNFFPVTGDFDPYYKSSPARSAGSFYPAAKNVAPTRPKAAGSARSVPVPVRFVGSDDEPEIGRVPFKRGPTDAARFVESEIATAPLKRGMSAEDAAVRIQAAARGFMARRAVRALRAVERDADVVAGKVAREAEALRGDARARIAVGEELMRLLFRLDAVRGAREFRRRVAKRVLTLQDAVDALGSVVAVEETAGEATTVDTVAEEGAAATEPRSADEESCVTEAVVAMDVDANKAAAEEPEPALYGADLGADKPADEDVEGEWEVVSEEHAGAVPEDPNTPPTEASPAATETTARPALAGAADGGMDTKKLMEMVAALCEQSAQQCAVIGALAERVDALERTVRRVEDAERRRRKAKKLRKEGKGSNHNKCFSD